MRWSTALTRRRIFLPHDFDAEQYVDDRSTPETRAEIAAIYVPKKKDVHIAQGEDDPTGRVPGGRYEMKFTEAVMDSLLRDENGDASLSIFSILLLTQFPIIQPAATINPALSKFMLQFTAIDRFSSIFQILLFFSYIALMFLYTPCALRT